MSNKTVAFHSVQVGRQLAGEVKVTESLISCLTNDIDYWTDVRASQLSKEKPLILGMLAKATRKLAALNARLAVAKNDLDVLQDFQAQNDAKPSHQFLSYSPEDNDNV